MGYIKNVMWFTFCNVLSNSRSLGDVVVWLCSGLIDVLSQFVRAMDDDAFAEDRYQSFVPE